MKCKFVVALALATAALSILAAPAVARLDGADRKAFMESSLKGCIDAIHKQKTTYSEKTIETYCGCMSEAEADMTTHADVEYMSAHNEPPQNYRARVQALAPACKRKGGVRE
jgi:hypothetical protein